VSAALHFLQTSVSKQLNEFTKSFKNIGTRFAFYTGGGSENPEERKSPEVAAKF
jgi:hypothetical protein